MLSESSGMAGEGFLRENRSDSGSRELSVCDMSACEGGNL